MLYTLSTSLRNRAGRRLGSYTPICMRKAAKKNARPASVAATTTMKDFGPRLRQLREARDLSQRELANLLAIDYMQVYRYEKGVNVPSADTVVKLAQILQVTTDELLTGQRAVADPPKIRSPKLLDRFHTLDQLPKDKQEIALQMLDAVISQHELESFTDRVRRPAVRQR